MVSRTAELQAMIPTLSVPGPQRDGKDMQGCLIPGPGSGYFRKNNRLQRFGCILRHCDIEHLQIRGTRRAGTDSTLFVVGDSAQLIMARSQPERNMNIPAHRH
jgi:hypothetical protein